MAALGPWHKWYKTARWQRLRQQVFLRDHFTCQMPGCGRLEGNTSRLVADHKQPHRGDERLFWNEANVQTLCKRCHDEKKQKDEQATLHQRGVWY
jgi:5-methylcytosine-specific restriction endonuclease McrA